MQQTAWVSHYLGGNVRQVLDRKYHSLKYRLSSILFCMPHCYSLFSLSKLCVLEARASTLFMSSLSQEVRNLNTRVVYDRLAWTWLVFSDSFSREKGFHIHSAGWYICGIPILCLPNLQFADIDENQWQLCPRCIGIFERFVGLTIRNTHVKLASEVSLVYEHLGVMIRIRQDSCPRLRAHLLIVQHCLNSDESSCAIIWSHTVPFSVTRPKVLESEVGGSGSYRYVETTIKYFETFEHCIKYASIVPSNELQTMFLSRHTMINQTSSFALSDRTPNPDVRYVALFSIPRCWLWMLYHLRILFVTPVPKLGSKSFLSLL